MRHQLHTEIDIDAPPAAVWQVLTDLPRYSDWNPFIVSSTGVPAVGQRIVSRLQPPGGRAITIKPTITEFEPNQTLEWLGRLGLPGLFDGRHRFELHGQPDGGTRVVHKEQFNGVLVRLLRNSLDTETMAGFELMNTALKTQVEAAVTSGS